jgi:hypothetical protein
MYLVHWKAFPPMDEVHVPHPAEGFPGKKTLLLKNKKQTGKNKVFQIIDDMIDKVK